MSDWIFLNHHSHTCPVKSLATQFIQDAMDHWLFGSTQKALEKIFNFFGFKGKHICFSMTGAESHYHLLFTHYVDCIRETGRTHILCAENEQKSLLASIKRLEKFEVQGRFLPVNAQGLLLPSVLQEAVRARSSLFSVSLAHPQTGVIQPIHEYKTICRENEISMHLDISAAIGKYPLQVTDVDVDFLTFEGGLLGMSFPLGIILSKQKIWSLSEFSYAQYANVASALSMSFDKVETYLLQIAPMRNFLEEALEKLGATLPFKHVERLPNVAAIQFMDIHSEQILHALKQEAILADSVDPFTVSFVLSIETKQEEIDRVVKVFPKILEKLRKKPRIFTKEDAKAKNMRFCQGIVHQEKEMRDLTLLLLVDEEDGVIGDAKYTAFGPPSFHQAVEVTCMQLLRKNYIQARRLTAECIEKAMSLPAKDFDLNCVLEAIDLATQDCMDIPIQDVYTAPPHMEEGERTEYLGWEALSNEQKKVVVAEVLDRDVRPYIELDAGGVEVLKVEENRITIAYSGNCTTCFSATGATLDAIGGILRHKIYPDIIVIPDVSLLQS